MSRLTIVVTGSRLSPDSVPKNSLRVWPGSPYPLGATWDGVGVNFALFSEHATQGRALPVRFAPTPKSRSLTHPAARADRHGLARLPARRPARASSTATASTARTSRSTGHRFNPNKVLLDPYAKAIGRDGALGRRAVRLHDRRRDDDLTFDERDSAPFAPLAAVVDTAFTWGDDRPPRTPWHKTLIYELHVKGFTKLQSATSPKRCAAPTPGWRRSRRSTTCTTLGVTAVELLPVHHHVDDRHLVEARPDELLGLQHARASSRPTSRYAAVAVAASTRVREFKTMVRALHAAGIEVILDVVYNHTAEGNQLGPTLSLRGIDNARYYRLSPDEPALLHGLHRLRQHAEHAHPRVLQLIMDSLRYWVLEMHVDGFRFDLASALARELHEVDQLGAFFDIIHQDPVLSQVKLIAEPWDLGAAATRSATFPSCGPSGTASTATPCAASGRATAASLSELATRLAGSSDLYEQSGRRPYASINFVTCHDGFTLHDLVSYNDKHNEANGEDNRDGANDNLSWNCGVEGPTDDPAHPRAARAAEAQPPGDAAALAGRADALRRRRDRPHPARQQQRLLPGQRDHLAQLGPRRRSSATSSSSRGG